MTDTHYQCFWRTPPSMGARRGGYVRREGRACMHTGFSPVTTHSLIDRRAPSAAVLINGGALNYSPGGRGPAPHANPALQAAADAAEAGILALRVGHAWHDYTLPVLLLVIVLVLQLVIVLSTDLKPSQEKSSRSTDLRHSLSGLQAD